jgi:hypothetical protein
MQVQYFLRLIQPQPGFVYSSVAMSGELGQRSMQVHLRARKGSKAVCSGCGKKRAGYDKAPSARSFAFVPLWGMTCTFVYRMRRVDCPKCGVVVELLPWATGKQQTTDAYACSLQVGPSRFLGRRRQDASAAPGISYFGACSTPFNGAWPTVASTVLLASASMNWPGKRAIST